MSKGSSRDHRSFSGVSDPLRPLSFAPANGSNAVRIQLVNATRSLNISAGVWKPSVLRGLWFNCLAIALS